MKYEIVRQNRKTMGIYIQKDGSIQVRCPFFTTTDSVNKFVESKKEWIISHSNKKIESNKTKSEFVIDFDSKILILGKEYSIKNSDDNKIRFDYKYVYFPFYLTTAHLRENLIYLYKKIAYDYISPKASEYARLMGLSFKNIKITGAKTRWGSCSNKSTLCFSWRLIMAADFAVDYVIVHELSHITEFNHQKRFWDKVEKYCPDYKKGEAELKKLSARLEKEVWE